MVWLETVTLERARRLERNEKIGKKMSNSLETTRFERMGKIGWKPMDWIQELERIEGIGRQGKDWMMTV